LHAHFAHTRCHGPKSGRLRWAAVIVRNIPALPELLATLPFPRSTWRFPHQPRGWIGSYWPGSTMRFLAISWIRSNPRAPHHAKQWLAVSQQPHDTQYFETPTLATQYPMYY
jgi:hypothetical protein